MHMRRINPSFGTPIKSILICSWIFEKFILFISGVLLYIYIWPGLLGIYGVFYNDVLAWMIKNERENQIYLYITNIQVLIILSNVLIFHRCNWYLYSWRWDLIMSRTSKEMALWKLLHVRSLFVASQSIFKILDNMLNIAHVITVLILAVIYIIQYTCI